MRVAVAERRNVSLAGMRKTLHCTPIHTVLQVLRSPYNLHIKATHVM